MLIVIVIFVPSNFLRIIIGLPFLLFFPGYTLIAALFPRRDDLGSVERVALSFGLSIAVVPLVGLILNYTPWGIRLYPVLISVATFILTTSILAWYRRRRLPEVARLKVSFNFSLSSWRGQSSVGKVLSVILSVAILVSIATVVYVIATPKAGERFTEFYILGLEGKAENYPGELVAGEEAKVMVGLVNHEHEMVSYRLEVRMNGVRNNEVGPLVVGHNEKWEELVGFTPHAAGDNQKVEFLLYKNGESKAYLTLHLWVSVKEQT
ncbi:DUF1616 domain-containing protein [Chloroflexota bacterium]